MNKEQHAAKSKELGLPCRCPLVGYCGRWAITQYLSDNNGTDVESNEDHAIHYLTDSQMLPSDYYKSSKAVPAARHGGSLPSIQDAYASTHMFRLSNACPDAMLNGLAGVSASCADIPDYESEEHEQDDATNIISKHFSECIEFVQSWAARQFYSAKKSVRRVPVPPKVRFAVLKRDEFKCVYCGANKDGGAELEIDHKISIRDGGTNDPSNLVTSCSTCNIGKGAESISGASA